MSYDHEALEKSLAQVEARVAAAAARAGRNPDEVTLIGVTKRHPPALIEAARAVGIRHIGENYAQELVDKYDHFAGATDVIWHYIGQLQRNKVKYVVGRAALIHAVDSDRLAREIDKQAAKAGDEGRLPGGVQRVLIAVNLGGEVQKSGVSEDQANELLELITGLDHVTCVGLMTMPPLAHGPEDNRPYFRRLAALRDRLAATHGPLPELSMGTTDDFEVAVEEGATMVRVGTALFGPRPTT
ncbi:YggS family pyridoxal phosphate-dependent enzyme [Haliangium sp.]|uniref:YggS family pyridoxal phosphate-dependent enzyme n=1 Tax=Haliangium sp. TaxID=2663208 RepID=UPI003D131F7E